MREKIYNILVKIYAILMTGAFFAGVIPLIPFIVAIIIGGTIGETITVFLYEQVYPYIIAGASIAVLIGVIAMYIGKKESLSINKMNNKDK